MLSIFARGVLEEFDPASTEFPHVHRGSVYTNPVIERMGGGRLVAQTPSYTECTAQDEQRIMNPQTSDVWA
ncbi:MAG: hypothetical protein LBF65_01445 [Holosporales bacterium]|nr:hypothetical protein [Holosporales bacterium]